MIGGAFATGGVRDTDEACDAGSCGVFENPVAPLDVPNIKRESRGHSNITIVELIHILGLYFPFKFPLHKYNANNDLITTIL